MKKTTGFVIIHYNQNKSEPTVRPLSETSFHKIKDTIKVRQSQVLFVKNHTKYVPKYLIYSHYICTVTGTIDGATETLQTYLNWSRNIHLKMLQVFQKDAEPHNNVALLFC